MKTLQLLVATGLLLGQPTAFANSVINSGPTQVVVGQTFTVTARFAQPLTSFLECKGPNPARLDSEISPWEREARGSLPGNEAYNEAASAALGACKDNFNADCKIVSATYTDIVSVEFIGYKACEARVVVHGYKSQ